MPFDNLSLRGHLCYPSPFAKPSLVLNGPLTKRFENNMGKGENSGKHFFFFFFSFSSWFSNLGNRYCKHFQLKPGQNCAVLLYFQELSSTKPGAKVIVSGEASESDEEADTTIPSIPPLNGKMNPFPHNDTF